MTRAVVTGRLVNRQIRAARLWWMANREKAPNAFDESLEEAFSLLARHGDAGIIVRSRRQGPIRRLYIERIRYFIFYRVTATTIDVVALWHASRRPPRL